MPLGFKDSYGIGFHGQLTFWLAVIMWPGIYASIVFFILSYMSQAKKTRRAFMPPCHVKTRF
jgi:hypothetical protein